MTDEPVYCILCGAKLRQAERSGRLRAVCPQCGHVHYANPIVAAGALVELGGRVLLVRRGVPPCVGHWALPAGYAEAGEHPEETALREVREETGVKAELDGLLAVETFGGHDEPSGVLLLYKAHALSSATTAGDDAVEARFFERSELPSDLAFAAHRRAINAWADAQNTSSSSRNRSEEQAS
mgnify:CR=1 FL=1